MLTDITLGQYYPGESFIHKLDPRTKILTTLIFISSIFLAVTYTAYGVLTLFVLLTVAVSRLPFKLVARSVKPLWIIILMTFIIHAFSTPGEPLYSWRFLSITEEGVQQVGVGAHAAFHRLGGGGAQRGALRHADLDLLGRQRQRLLRPPPGPAAGRQGQRQQQCQQFE